MAQTPPLELKTDGVLAFLGAFDALRTWEFLRSAARLADHARRKHGER
jgi:hypothetical protein